MEWPEASGKHRSTVLQSSAADLSSGELRDDMRRLSRGGSPAGDLTETDSEGEVLEAAFFGISGITARLLEVEKLHDEEPVQRRCPMDNVSSFFSVSGPVFGGRAGCERRSEAKLVYAQK